MRVVVNGWFWDRPETGSGQYVQRVIDALAQASAAKELQILLPYDTRDCADVLAARQNVRLVSYPIDRSHLRKLWWEQVLVPQVARRLDADLIHVPYWAPPVVSPRPVVVTAHDIIPLVLPAYRGNARVRLYTALVSAATSRARLVLTDSEASKADIVKHLHVPRKRVRAIPLAVGPEYVPEPMPEDPSIRKDLNLPGNYILYLGGFDIRKNLQAVFAAFSVVHQACPDARLVIGGRLPTNDTPFTPDPRRLAAEAGLPHNAVQFLGFVKEDEKPAVYRGARVFMFPSIYEGFGYPPLEAISCGVPVVGSNASSLPEVIGSAGVLLDPQDVSGMAGAVIQLLNDHAFHDDLQQRAIRQSQCFSWTRTSADTSAAFHEALT